MAKDTRRRWSGDRLREAFAGYGFILPNFLGFCAFVSIPIIVSFYFAFTEYSVLEPPKWVGTRNFTELLGFHREDVPVFRTEKNERGIEVQRLVTTSVTRPDGTIEQVPVTENRVRPNDPKFYQYCWNTIFLMMGIPIGMAAALGMALI